MIAISRYLVASLIALFLMAMPTEVFAMACFQSTGKKEVKLTSRKLVDRIDFLESHFPESIERTSFAYERKNGEFLLLNVIKQDSQLLEILKLKENESLSASALFNRYKAYFQKIGFKDAEELAAYYYYLHYDKYFDSGKLDNTNESTSIHFDLPTTHPAVPPFRSLQYQFPPYLAETNFYLFRTSASKQKLNYLFKDKATGDVQSIQLPSPKKVFINRFKYETAISSSNTTNVLREIFEKHSEIDKYNWESLIKSWEHFLVFAKYHLSTAKLTDLNQEKLSTQLRPLDNVEVIGAYSDHGYRKIVEELLAINHNRYYLDQSSLFSKLAEIVKASEAPPEVFYFSELLREYMENIPQDQVARYAEILVETLPGGLVQKVESLLREKRSKTTELDKQEHQKREKISSQELFQNIANHLFILRLNNIQVPFSTLLVNAGIRRSKLKTAFKDLLHNGQLAKVQAYLLAKERTPKWSHRFINALKEVTTVENGRIIYTPGYRRLDGENYNYPVLANILSMKKEDQTAQPKLGRLTGKDKIQLFQKLSESISAKQTTSRPDSSSKEFKLELQFGDLKLSLDNGNIYAYFPHLSMKAQEKVLKHFLEDSVFAMNREALVNKVVAMLESGETSRSSMDPRLEISLRKHLIYSKNLSEWGKDLSSDQRQRLAEALK